MGRCQVMAISPMGAYMADRVVLYLGQGVSMVGNYLRFGLLPDLAYRPFQVFFWYVPKYMFYEPKNTIFIVLIDYKKKFAA